MKRSWILIVAFYLIFIPSVGLAAFDHNSKEFKEVISQLDMQGHADHDFATCSVQKVYYEEVVDMLNEGKSEQDILNSYVDEYGQQALRVPATEGGGIIAWVMPAFIFLIGAIVVAYWIKKLTVLNHQKAAATNTTFQSNADQEVLEKIIEEERHKFF
ncbi:cytochrome c-type biogenesis protein CcmH [Cytobacillus spongiae]|jgi:cytochrome c-type biogenesis protein CcmH|uniref:cytochrome c-type biogenesis protein CcmH n=1 Tax=Cytobacillus spongiae TaxID=2901381 RepID=UPI001F419AB4|nr:cytochrome c-type biogenesis protein CcmH [Cytobacillus spongiae]UII55276.1 cytochrome c-type biogenesis protein CcmH [Cytobacillus spongiae]